MAATPELAPTPQPTPRSIRGPLRYQIATSSPQLEAGTKFSIYTRITNPYDVPVSIISVTTLLPVEFIDVLALEKVERKRNIVALMNSVQRASAEKGSGSSIFPWASKLKSPPQTSSARMSSEPVSSVPEADIISFSDPLSIVQLIQTSENPELAKDQALTQLRAALAESEDPGGLPVLQPGNSVIRVFTLKTNRAIFFPPNVYQSSVRIEYEIDKAKNIDVADYQLNVRAPLKAILYGAVIGSLFGVLLKDLTGDNKMLKLIASSRSPQDVVGYILSLVASVMLAGIVVVAFARKKDSQPILSVEDFWGGIFVGFLAGYTGKTFLEKLIPVPGAVPAAVPTASPTPH